MPKFFIGKQFWRSKFPLRLWNLNICKKYFSVLSKFNDKQKGDVWSLKLGWQKGFLSAFIAVKFTKDFPLWWLKQAHSLPSFQIYITFLIMHGFWCDWHERSNLMFFEKNSKVFQLQRFSRSDVKSFFSLSKIYVLWETSRFGGGGRLWLIGLTNFMVKKKAEN